MAVGILWALGKVFLPLIAIAGIAYLVLHYRSGNTGSLRVTTSVPGAEVLIGGMQTGMLSDTTVLLVPTGRKIVTVRKANYISDPEFASVRIGDDSLTSVRFVLRPASQVLRTDSIPPLRSVRQEIFSTGEPVLAVPPAPRVRPLVNFERRSAPPREPVSQEPLAPAHEPDSAPPESAPPAEDQWTSDTFSEETTSLVGTEITVSSNPEGARIFVNGAPTPRTTPYTFRGLDRGIYVFRVESDAALAEPDSITVALSLDDQHELASFNVLPDLTIPKPTLVVSTAPLAAGISVNGKNAGVGGVTQELAYGVYQIEFAEVPGYLRPEAMTVELTRDQPRVELRGDYQKLIGNSYLALLPGEEFEKFDPTLLRVYVDNELVLDGPDSTFDVSLVGKIAAGNRLIRVQYGELTNDIHVELQDGQVSEIVFRIESFFSKRSLRLRERNTVALEKWQEKSRRLTVLNLG